MKQVYKVVSQSEAISVQKQDGGSIMKSTIVLQEFGGRYEDSYVCTLLGNTAQCKFEPNSLVYAALRFSHREHNGNFFQDIIVQDIIII